MAPTHRPHQPSTLSEADMQAFADGLLSPERAAEVERYLRGRPDEARRVAFYGRLNGMMQTRFDHGALADHGFVPPRLHWRASLLSVLRHRARPALAGLAALLLVAGAAVLAVRVPPRSLDNAALAELAALSQTGAHGQAGTGGHTGASEQAGVAAVLAQASAAVPTAGTADVIAPDLSHADMHVQSTFRVRVGLLSHADGVVYRNQLGEPVVLLRVDDPTAQSQPQWRALRAGNDRLLMWTSGHTRYVLAGRANTRGLMQAADLLTLGSSLMSRGAHAGADAASSAGARP